MRVSNALFTRQWGCVLPSKASKLEVRKESNLHIYAPAAVRSNQTNDHRSMNLDLRSYYIFEVGKVRFLLLEGVGSQSAATSGSWEAHCERWSTPFGTTDCQTDPMQSIVSRMARFQTWFDLNLGYCVFVASLLLARHAVEVLWVASGLCNALTTSYYSTAIARGVNWDVWLICNNNNNNSSTNKESIIDVIIRVSTWWKRVWEIWE